MRLAVAVTEMLESGDVAVRWIDGRHTPNVIRLWAKTSSGDYTDFTVGFGSDHMGDHRHTDTLLYYKPSTVEMFILSELVEVRDNIGGGVWYYFPVNHLLELIISGSTPIPPDRNWKTTGIGQEAEEGL